VSVRIQIPAFLPNVRPIQSELNLKQLARWPRDLILSLRYSSAPDFSSSCKQGAVSTIIFAWRETEGQQERLFGDMAPNLLLSQLCGWTAAQQLRLGSSASIAFQPQPVWRN